MGRVTISIKKADIDTRHGVSLTYFNYSFEAINVEALRELTAKLNTQKQTKLTVMIM
mgnify:CR=1 FL=1